MKKRLISYILSLVLFVGCILSALSLGVLATASDADFTAAVADMRAAADDAEMLTSAEAAREALFAYTAEGGDLLALDGGDLSYYQNEAFIIFVFTAADLWEMKQYLPCEKYLGYATELYSDIDENYPVVDGAKQTYGSISREVKLAEEGCEAFIERVKEAKAGEDYLEIKTAYDAAVALDKETPSFMKTYEGYAEAYAALDGIDEALTETSKVARQFINRVTNIFSYENPLLAIKEAYALYKTVDTSVNGVAEAKFNLDSIVEEYNGQRAPANEANDLMNVIVFAFVI